VSAAHEPATVVGDVASPCARNWPRTATLDAAADKMLRTPPAKQPAA